MNYKNFELKKQLFNLVGVCMSRITPLDPRLVVALYVFFRKSFKMYYLHNIHLSIFSHLHSILIFINL